MPLLKKHIRLAHAGNMDHSVDLSISDLKKKYNKGIERSNKKYKKVYTCITANTSAIWQHAVHTTDQLLLAAKPEPYKKKKAYLLTRRMGQQAERVTDSGRTREETVKWNQMTALRFQMWWWWWWGDIRHT